MPTELVKQAEPLPVQVTQFLLERIRLDKLKPGDQVPSEVQTSRDLQVSRGSVREAYRTLAALGVLEIGNGRKPRLAAMSSQVVSQVLGYALSTAQITVQNVQESRRGIEIQSAQLAALRATEAQKTSLIQRVEQMRDAVGDHARRIEADLAIHRELAQASHNPLNLMLLDALHEPLVESLFVDLGERRNSAELEQIVDVHSAIVARVCAADAVGAGVAMAYHFDFSLHIKERDSKA